MRDFVEGSARILYVEGEDWLHSKGGEEEVGSWWLPVLTWKLQDWCGDGGCGSLTSIPLNQESQETRDVARYHDTSLIKKEEEWTTRNSV